MPTERTDGTCPKRLPGVWIICVLFGLAGMLSVSVVFLATPLGVAVFGGAALLCFVAGLGLWRRSDVARLVVMVLLALLSVCLIVDFASDRYGNAFNAIPLCTNLAIIAYLWFRREHFKVSRAQKAGLLYASGVVAAALVFFPGLAWTLLATIDDAPKEFPRLEVRREPVPDQENAFVVFQEMLDTWPEWEDEETSELLCGDGRYKDPDPRLWRAKAREVVGEWEGWLAKTDEMLSRPHFAPPVPQTFSEAVDSDMEWCVKARELARRLCFQADLHSLEGRPEKAIRSARQAVDFGLMLCEQNDALITYLVGNAVMAMGLDRLRQVAAAPQADAGVVQLAMADLPDEDGLRRAVRRALGQEFAVTQQMMAALKDPRQLHRLGELELASVLLRWQKFVRDPVPLLKLNMTRNALGEAFQGPLARVDRYQPLPPEPEPDGLWHRVRTTGALSFARNPIGDIFVDVLTPALEGLPQVHLRAVADARLTQVFLALRCHHLEHGRLPETLEELAPEYFDAVPVDPFSESPFGYDVGAETPLIYSVGPDQEPDPPDAEPADDAVIELTFAVGKQSP